MMICTDKFEVVAGPCTLIEWYKVEVTDLWRDDFGWSANCSWVKRYFVPINPNDSSAYIARKLKAVAGVTGMRADCWAGTEFCWRNGFIGVYAESIEGV